MKSLIPDMKRLYLQHDTTCNTDFPVIHIGERGHSYCHITYSVFRYPHRINSLAILESDVMLTLSVAGMLLNSMTSFSYHSTAQQASVLNNKRDSMFYKLVFIDILKPRLTPTLNLFSPLEAVKKQARNLMYPDSQWYDQLRYINALIHYYLSSLQTF